MRVHTNYIYIYIFESMYETLFFKKDERLLNASQKKTE